MHSMPRLMPSRTPSVKVIISAGTAYSSHIISFTVALVKYLYRELAMASKLDTLLKQLETIKGSLTDDDQKTKRIVDTIAEIVQYIQTIQEECIKLLQERSVEERAVPQPPFRWDSLRNDRSPFKAPFGPFSD